MFGGGGLRNCSFGERVELYIGRVGEPPLQLRRDLELGSLDVTPPMQSWVGHAAGWDDFGKIILHTKKVLTEYANSEVANF